MTKYRVTVKTHAHRLTRYSLPVEAESIQDILFNPNSALRGFLLDDATSISITEEQE